MLVLVFCGICYGGTRQLAANFVEPVGRGKIIYARRELRARGEEENKEEGAGWGSLNPAQNMAWSKKEHHLRTQCNRRSRDFSWAALLRKDRKRMSCMQSPINYEYEIMVPRGKLEFCQIWQFRGADENICPKLRRLNNQQLIQRRRMYFSQHTCMLGLEAINLAQRADNAEEISTFVLNHLASIAPCAAIFEAPPLLYFHFSSTGWCPLSPLI